MTVPRGIRVLAVLCMALVGHLAACSVGDSPRPDPARDGDGGSDGLAADSGSYDTLIVSTWGDETLFGPNLLFIATVVCLNGAAIMWSNLARGRFTPGGAVRAAAFTLMGLFWLLVLNKAKGAEDAGDDA